MTTYPLLYKFFHWVHVGQVKAGVGVRGRGLLYDDKDGWWLTGVDAGGITAEGTSPVEALGNFRIAFGQVIDELATQAPSFEQFKIEVLEFFGEVNNPAEIDWTERRAEIRANGLPHLTPVMNMRQVTEDFEPVVEVIENAPSEGVIDSVEVAA